jgi:Holliday junction resolvasome RuvABC endonuclease subunit
MNMVDPEQSILKARHVAVRTLNLDPALSKCGWSVLDLKRVKADVDVQCVRCGTLTPSAIAGRAMNAIECEMFTKRIISLRELRAGIRDLIKTFQPDFITIEDTFFHSSFPTAYAALEQCITTIALLCYDEFHLPLYRIPTKSAKQAITSSGASKKGTVLSAIQDTDIISFRQKKKVVDLDHHAADSIAVGYHFLINVWPNLEKELAQRAELLAPKG